VLLPETLRETLVEELDDYVEAVGGSPDAEAVSTYVIELLEEAADEAGLDDLIGTMEDEGNVDGTLAEVMEAEFGSNEEFACTGEEIISFLERLCGIEWGKTSLAAAEEEEEEDDDDDEEGD
jgi:hypothetical protein